jgi:tetratricopeptide (TPR) repeat protein
MAVNRSDESMSEIKLAEELDPFSWDRSQCFGWHCLFTKGYDEAITLAQEGVRLNPKNAWAHIILGWSYEQKSMIDEAIIEFQGALSEWRDNSLPLAGLSHAYAISGRTGEAREILEKLLEMSKLRYVPAYDIAVVYVGLGDRSRAFEWLAKAYEERSGFLVYIKCDRRFDGLRSEPQYAALLQRIGLPAETVSAN